MSEITMSGASRPNCATASRPSCAVAAMRQPCAAQSIELNLNRGNVSAAYGAKEKGYGWFMWFAFDPSPTSNIENKEGSVRAFKEAADGLYGMDLVEPTGYYKKVTPGGDVGGYDPTRYEF